MPVVIADLGSVMLPGIFLLLLTFAVIGLRIWQDPFSERKATRPDPRIRHTTSAWRKAAAPPKVRSPRALYYDPSVVGEAVDRSDD